MSEVKNGKMDERIVLTGVTWNHPRGYNPLIAASEMYFNTHQVQVNWTKRSLTAFGDQSLENLSKQFDLLVIDHPHVGEAAFKGLFTPIDTILPKENIVKMSTSFVGPSWASYYYKSHQWAVPIDAAVQTAAMKSTDTQAVEWPSDWQAAFQLADRLRSTNRWVAMALCPTDSLCTFLSLTASMGSPIKEGDTEILNPEVACEALTLMAQMRDKFHPNSLEWNPIQLYDHMVMNKEIVYSPLAFCYNSYVQMNDQTHGLQFGPPPVINPVLGGAGLAISSNGAHQIQAAHFAAWLCSAAIQRSVYLNNHGQPAAIAAWRCEENEHLQRIFFNNILPVINHAYVRPRQIGWPSFQTHLGEKIHTCLKQRRQAHEVVKELSSDYRKTFQH
jgi:multiple sugar transport system substrate-binding protein